jgi:hypothetical protein
MKVSLDARRLCTRASSTLRAVKSHIKRPRAEWTASGPAAKTVRLWPELQGEPVLTLLFCETEFLSEVIRMQD